MLVDSEDHIYVLSKEASRVKINIGILLPIIDILEVLVIRCRIQGSRQYHDDGVC